MPGSVSNAVPSLIMPITLSRMFVHAREFELEENLYRNGESQRRLDVATSRKSWRVGKLLTVAEVLTLRDFFNARRGALESFFYYDPWDTVPQFKDNPTGSTGRYIVRFDGEWSQVAEFALISVTVNLVELA